MRMAVITNKNMINLGVFAKDHFVKHVLKVDDDGKSFDVLQTVGKDTLEKLKDIPLYGGYTQEIKDGAIKAFEEMEVGEKFLCIDAWITNYESEEAKFFWEVQRLCNEDNSLKDATALANKWLKEQREKEKCSLEK